MFNLSGTNIFSCWGLISIIIKNKFHNIIQKRIYTFDILKSLTGKLIYDPKNIKKIVRITGSPGTIVPFVCLRLNVALIINNNSGETKEAPIKELPTSVLRIKLISMFFFSIHDPE